MDWMELITNEKNVENEVFSFFDYMESFNQHAPRECRPTYQYILDMIDYFGQTEDGHYKVFQLDHPDAPPVHGQKSSQVNLIQNLRNFQKEGFNNKFILLIGPNGSAKSSLVKKLMKGAEDYSEKAEGSLYTFSWVFPIENYVKGALGLSNKGQSKEIASYAYLDDKEISAIITSDLKDHPLLLLPQKQRQQIIEQSLQNYPQLLQTVKKSYLFNGGPSKRNHIIYEALLKNYKGDHKEVLKHIRVERFTINKRYSSGAVTIEPQIHVDARIQQITMDKRLASLPPSLQSLNLFSLQGEVILANRGILEYSDLLKRPLDTYKYLLMTMESGTVNLQGILTELDIFFIGTSNEIHFAAFKQHPDFNSFKGRFNFVRVPYLLDYKSEEKIYQAQIESLKSKAIFEPLALRALCIFSVMTRLRCCLAKNYENKKLGDIVTALNPMEKTLFWADDVAPNRLSMESKQILKQGQEEVKTEFENDNLYEGKFGISPREIKHIIYRLTSNNTSITFVEVLEYLQRLITKKNEYDFLNMNAQGDFHHPARFLALIKEHCIDIFDRQLRDCLGLVDDRSYEDYIKRYIENVSALIKGEKIKNTITGKYELVDDYIINDFESSIGLKEDVTLFRSQLISKLGAYSLDHPGKKISYTDVFPELVEKLRESFRKEQKKVIANVAKNIVFYEAELNNQDQKNGEYSSPLSDNIRSQIRAIIHNLSEKHGFSEKGSLSMLKYTIVERY